MLNEKRIPPHEAYRFVGKAEHKWSKTKKGWRLSDYEVTESYACETLAPTMEPTKSPTNENATVTTAEPTVEPTTEPTAEATTDEVIFYFYDTSNERIDFMFLLNYYDYNDDTIFSIYDVCGLGKPTASDVLYAAVDTFYTIPDYACLFFGGDILTSTDGKYDPDEHSFTSQTWFSWCYWFYLW